MTESRFSNLEKLREAVREVGYRKRVYAQMVKDKRMRQSAADTRIAIMEAIADDYRKLAERDEPEIKFPDSY